MIVRDAVEGFMATFNMLEIQNQLRSNSIQQNGLNTHQNAIVNKRKLIVGFDLKINYSLPVL